MARAGCRIDVCRGVLGRARAPARRLLHRTEGRGDGVKRALLLLSTFALLVPANAFARGEFDPTPEFEQHEWIPIHLGPINMSITKAVAYLMLGAACTMLFGYVFMRSKVGQKPGRKETFGELVYEIAQTQ